MSVITETINSTANLLKENGVHADEMHTGIQTLEVDFERFFGVVPSKANKTFLLTLAEQSYLPKVGPHRFHLQGIQSLNQ